jgi:hypothetical protein
VHPIFAFGANTHVIQSVMILRQFVIASEAKQSSGKSEGVDCFVASLLAMTTIIAPST